MKNVFRVLLITILLMLVYGVLWAGDKKIIAVLPFTVHSGENIDYVKQGIWDMLSSRISVIDKIEVLGKDVTLNALKEMEGKDLTVADVYGLGKKINVDYVIWGSITKIGNSLSIDGKLVDMITYKSTVSVFSQSQGMDDIIPKINDFAQRIDQHILGTAPSTFSPPVSSQQTPSTQQQPSVSSREADVVSGMRSGKKGTLTAIINPEFISSPEPLIRKDFWMSKKFPVEIKGMDIGDVTNDGKNKVVIIDSHNVMIYQKKDNDFVLVQKYEGKSSDDYLSVDVADINKNGTKQIFVTNMRGTTLESFVLEFRDGQFIPIASKLPWFLRVVESESATYLLGQRRGFDNPFDKSIHEIIWEDGKYREGMQMKIPGGLSVYGMTLDSLVTGGTEKVIALDNADYLNVFEKTDKPLERVQTFGSSKERIWKSDESFGGSNNSFSTAQASVSVTTDSVTSDKVYINHRILTHDINHDGKKKIIVVKNLSISGGSLFKNVKLFSSSELHEFEWDGLGLIENWKTRKINGYIADYQFKDVDNDGQKEIVLAIVMSGGSFATNTSVIVVYKVNPQQGG